MKEIRNILNTYDQADHTKEQFALAVVVNVEESSYRRIGARMLVSSSGNWMGGISGGCLEGDALRRSQLAIYKKEVARVVYDTMEDDSNQIGVGLGCNGRLEVMFLPIEPKDPNNPIEQLRKVVAANSAAIVVIAIDVDKNHQLLGESQLIQKDIDNIDFCGVEGSLLSQAIMETRINRRPQIIDITNKDGDQLKVLVEYIRPEMKLVIVGDNYDVLALTGIAKELGWEYFIIGRRKKISKTLYQNAKGVFEYEDALQVPIDEYTAIILMSHDYNWDKKLLPQFLAAAPTYVGMLGPKKRMVKMKQELGLSDLDNIPFFHSPIGLDIGAESPEEIALSITAEIIAAFRNRQGTSLKLRSGTIHVRG